MNTTAVTRIIHTSKVPTTHSVRCLRSRATVVVIVTVLSAASTICRSSGSAAAGRAAALSVAPVGPRVVSDARTRLAKSPSDRTAVKALAAALLQQVREDADPSHYVEVDGLLRKLGGAKSRDPEVLVLQGTLLLARHEFADAADVGRRAVTAQPNRASAHGILVDAYNELGRYDEAIAETQTMVDLRPDLSAFARVSYARELRGDLPGATIAMQQAVSAAPVQGEAAAYVRTLLGNLLLMQNDIEGASATYASARQAFPKLTAARAGEASVAAARGNWAEAARLLSAVVDIEPQLHYVIALSEYYKAAGMQKKNEETRQLIDAIAALYRANGVNIDIDLAVYEANRRASPKLVASTQRAVAKRPGVIGRHALAWVLHRSGRSREAAGEIRSVLAIGDRDPVMRFHAAVIFAAAGDRLGAGAQLDIVLAGNPRAVGIDQKELAALARSLGRTVPPPPR